MKISNQHINNEYYHDLTRSRYSSRTSRRLKSTRHFDQMSDVKTKFFNRIEKACTTTNTKDLMKEINLCKRQIERLEKDNLKKDKVILEIKSTAMLNKELEAQLIETYRIIYMYEGKINEYQKELKRLEGILCEKLPKDLTGKVEELLESYRVDNGELQANLEEKNRIIFELQKKIKSTETKYFSATWKLSSTKRQITNPLKQRFPNLRNAIIINQAPLLEKEKAFIRKVISPHQKTQGNYKMNQSVEKPKEFIRFKKMQNKGEKVETKMVTPHEKRISMENEQVRTQYGKFDLKQEPRQPSPNTQRKVYSSAINRFEISRPAYNTISDGGGVYTNRFQQKGYPTKQEYVYFHKKYV